jgi:hypothetical protein
MPISHEEIAKRFVESKAVDYNAVGRFIAELGPILATQDQGWHGVSFGKYNFLACMLTASDLNRLVGNLRTAELTAAVLEGAGQASLPK